MTTLIWATVAILSTFFAGVFAERLWARLRDRRRSGSTDFVFMKPSPGEGMPRPGMTEVHKSGYRGPAKPKPPTKDQIPVFPTRQPTEKELREMPRAERNRIKNTELTRKINLAVIGGPEPFLSEKDLFAEWYFESYAVLGELMRGLRLRVIAPDRLVISAAMDRIEEARQKFGIEPREVFDTGRKQALVKPVDVRKSRDAAKRALDAMQDQKLAKELHDATAEAMRDPWYRVDDDLQGNDPTAILSDLPGFENAALRDLERKKRGVRIEKLAGDLREATADALEEMGDDLSRDPPDGRGEA